MPDSARRYHCARCHVPVVSYKYCFQTKLTRETVGERIRGPMGMWDTNETFIDNNIQLVMNRLHEYYDDEEAAA